MLSGALRVDRVRSILATEGVLPGNKRVDKGDKRWDWITICMSQESQDVLLKYGCAERLLPNKDDFISKRQAHPPVGWF